MGEPLKFNKYNLSRLALENILRELFLNMERVTRRDLGDRVTYLWKIGEWGSIARDRSGRLESKGIACCKLMIRESKHKTRYRQLVLVCCGSGQTWRCDIVKRHENLMWQIESNWFNGSRWTVLLPSSMQMCSASFSAAHGRYLPNYCCEEKNHDICWNCS